MLFLLLLTFVGMLVVSIIPFAQKRARLVLAPFQAGRAGGRGDASVVDDARLVGELKAAASAAVARVEPVSDFRRSFHVVRTANAPTIDGRLDDEVWKLAAPLDGFLVAQSFNDPNLPSPAADRTEARVLFDDDGLYVGVRAFQDPSAVYTTIKENGWLRPDLDWEQRGEPWANTGCDEIEIVIDPELTMSAHYVFQVNPDGVRKKLYMPPARPEDGFYKRIDPVEIVDDAWVAATSRDENGWCAEVFIPWESIRFQKLRPSAETDVFVDMVQDRSVMGFNVNRVVHTRHEPSSWSPSRGTMFFRDAHNFGIAYFAASPARIDNVRFGEITRDSGKVTFDVRSTGGVAAQLVAEAVLEADGGSRAQNVRVNILPGAVRSVSLPFAPPVGQSCLDLRLADSRGNIIDRSRWLMRVPKAVDAVALKTILYKGERDFPVRLTVNLPDGAADSIVYRLLRAGKVVASEKSDALPRGEFALPFELPPLAVGEYTFEARLLSGRKVAASAQCLLRIIADPFATKVSGKAGKGRPSAAVPAGFAALGDGTADEARQPVFEGEVEWLDDDARRQGALLYPVAPTDDFFKGGRLRTTGGAVEPPRRAENAAGPIRAFAAGGQYEALAFGVFALKELKHPKVEFSSLRTASGKSIPRTSVDLRAERSDGYLVRQEVLGDIPSSAARRYFLTAYVAPGTPAGLYETTVTFTAASVRLERKAQLLVLPFALDETPVVGSVYGSFFGDRRDDALAADLLAHGMDNLTCVGVLQASGIGKAMIHHLLWDLYIPTEENWLGDGADRFAARLDRDVFAKLAKYRFKGPMVVEVNYFLRYLPCTRENADLFEAVLRKIEAARAKYGLPEFVYHLVDEPSNHYTYDDGRYGRRYGLERVDFFGAVLKRLGLRQYVTINSTGRGFDSAEKFRDVIDMWVPNSISDERQVERWTAPGKEIWLYNYAGDGPCKGAMRSTFGFYAHRVKASGVTIWHHPNFVRWEGGDKRCIAKSAWDAARAGRDDARYVATLRALAEKALAKGGAAARAAKRALSDLDAIISAYPVLTPEKVRFETRHHADQWNKWRWIIAQHILRLKE